MKVVVTTQASHRAGTQLEVALCAMALIRHQISLDHGRLPSRMVRIISSSF